MTDTFVRPEWATLDIGKAEHRFVVTSGESFGDTDPATGALVAVVRSSTVDDVSDAVARANAAFSSSPWRNGGALRSRVLWRFAERLRANIDELAELLSREQGKSLREARTEVLAAANLTDYYAGLARSVYGRSMALGDTAHGVVLPEPLGVIAVITPWNWPLQLLMRSLAPALAAGNAVVVKPASLTPAITVRALSLLAADPDLPEGILTVLLGAGSVIGDALVEADGVDMICFTGESATGSSIMRKAATRIRKVALELGGKSPNVVFADADLDKAVAGALDAFLTTTGQICTAGSRLLVERSVAGEFVDALVARADALSLGDQLDPTTTLAPLVSGSQRASVEQYIDRARAEGTVLTRDRRPEGELSEGAFVPPTIVADLPMESAVVQEEIFGPVLTVHAFDDEDEAVALANGTQFGLAAGVWTRDVDRAWRMGRGIRSGTVWVNTYHHFYAETEVGGFGASGLGRQGGVQGLYEFTETKHINFDSKVTLW
jgi:acyl-CoA reductase-like NAD-dependent aldehyde dehydrogenase